MWGSPDGYGSISSTYEVGTPSSVTSLETSQVRSSSQTRCHLGSMWLGSYRCSDAIASAEVSAAINWPVPGAIAQLGERLAGSQKVVGSSPTSSIVNVRPLR